MNVLLVFPFSIIAWNNKYEEPRIPLNITYLAAAARQAGHNVALVDLRVEQQKRGLPMPRSLEDDDARSLTAIMADKIIAHKAQVVGINCLYSGLFPVVIHLARKIKALNPDIKILIGGIHPTIYAREILVQYAGLVDYIICGEGERSLVHLLDALAEDPKKVLFIDGLGCRVDGQVRVNPKSSYVQDLDQLPFPAVDLLTICDYFIDTSTWHSPKGLPIRTPVPIITSRSCPNMCNFCSMHFVHGRRIRFRSPENVIEELKMYVHTYGLTYFNFSDDNLTIDKRRLIKLMDLIVKEKLDIQFSTENGVYVNSLDEEVLDAMSRAGLARLHLAFETGSDYIRTKVIGKNLLNKKINELREIIVQNKYDHIFLYGYFIIGFPEETAETLNETYQLITSFPLDNYSIFYAVPFPGTKLYQQCVKEKLFAEEYFYDSNLLVNQVDVGQMVKGDPLIKPYSLELSELVSFKEKALDYLKQKRNNASVPMSSPLRFNKNAKTNIHG